MKVALIADVHANLPALEAVLADARERGAETVWNLGDFVGYGPFPDQVVQRLAGGTAPGQPRQPRGAISLIGNYDRKVLAFEQKKDRWRRRKAPEKLLAFRWACENLSEASLAHLRSLPEQVRLEAAGLRVLLTHGSPADDDEPLGPDTTQGRLEELAGGTEADLVACGHSHQPFVRRAAGGIGAVETRKVTRAATREPVTPCWRSNGRTWTWTCDGWPMTCGASCGPFAPPACRKTSRKCCGRAGASARSGRLARSPRRRPIRPRRRPARPIACRRSSPSPGDAATSRSTPTR